MLYLPPRAQAPAIDYGIAMGIPQRVSERGIHCPKLPGRRNFRRSSRSCHFVFLHLIDNPDAGYRFDSNRPGQKRDGGRTQRGRRVVNQRVKRQPLFMPAADSTLHFWRGSALIETSSASSNAPEPGRSFQH